MNAEGWLGRIADGWIGRLGGRPGRRPPRRTVRAAVRHTPRRRVRRRVGWRPGPRFVLALIVLVALLLGAWLWLRDSSLVAVQRVTVTGVRGPDAAEVRAALISAGRNMTTLDVRMKQLNMAVAPFPVVKSLRVTTQFPHGLRIRVIEQAPVAAIMIGGHSVAVAGDGTLLHDSVASGPLPVIPLRVPPGGTRISDPSALEEITLLAAAPYQLLAELSGATTTSAHGLVAQLRDGPAIYFGDAKRLTAKWAAATGVLADSRSAGALYIDVTDPVRPAAGAASGSGTTGPAATATAPASAGAMPALTGAAPATTTTPGGG